MTDQSPTREELIERLEKLIAPSHRRVWNDVISNYEYQFQPPAKVQLSSDDLAALISLLRSDSQRIAELEGRLKASQGAENSLADGSVEASTPLSAGWRDISTAPKDGTPILACSVNHDGCEVVCWREAVHLAEAPDHEDAEGWVNNGHLKDRFYANPRWFTHWAPIPHPPVDRRTDDRLSEAMEFTETRDEQIDPALQTQGADNAAK